MELLTHHAQGFVHDGLRNSHVDLTLYRHLNKLTWPSPKAEGGYSTVAVKYRSHLPSAPVIVNGLHHRLHSLLFGQAAGLIGELGQQLPAPFPHYE
ncbi:MAG: hypothetical protein JO182_28170 [Acidobacteriaceae bacterium]|nr:hypothetical protein [Acidobacteriaceae bacterium]